MRLSTRFASALSKVCKVSECQELVEHHFCQPLTPLPLALPLSRLSVPPSCSTSPLISAGHIFVSVSSVSKPRILQSLNQPTTTQYRTDGAFHFLSCRIHFKFYRLPILYQTTLLFTIQSTTRKIHYRELFQCLSKKSVTFDLARSMQW